MNLCAFLIEGEAYFRAFRKAVLAAEREVFLMAWDLMHSVRLIREPENDGYPAQLAEFLSQVLDAKPELHIHILLWDYSMIYIAERMAAMEPQNALFHREYPKYSRYRTFPAVFPLFALDRIGIQGDHGNIVFHRPDFHTARTASDHRPVVAEVCFGGNAPAVRN